MNIPGYTLDMIRNATDIVSLIGQWVDLKKSGASHVGLCPFHNETSPSFTVHKKGFFKCHGCGEGGDAIQFLILSGMGFRDAVGYLGERVGINVEADHAPPPNYDPKKRARDVARTQQQEQEQRELEWEKVGRKQTERFAKAGAVVADHPYLVAKGVTSAPGLRQEHDDLLIPMRKVEVTDKLIMGIQTISPNGDKLFATGQRVAGTRTVIAPDAFRAEVEAGKTPTLYICEGWATGWTIWHLTGHSVVVAFTDGNLKRVAVATAERYPDANIIIAADNDRWSATMRGPNPGVTAARDAAAAAGCAVAIPDFEDPGDGKEVKRTDFNDLWLAEGDEAVTRWLDPELADSAVVISESGPVAPQMAAQPLGTNGSGATESTEEPQKRKTWLDTAPFRPVGYNHGIYYYLPKGTGQVQAYSAKGTDKRAMMSLASLGWWRHNFGDGDGKMGPSGWDTALDALLRACEREGVYRPERLRGRGCWVEDGRVLLHLGDRLLPPDGGDPLPAEDYKGSHDHIYERREPISGLSGGIMPLSESRQVLALCRDLLWIEPASGDLLAGWIALAPLAGALSWRPHVWLTGSSGAGKSEVIKCLIVPLLGGPIAEGGMAAWYEGGTTEAGIRQELRSDALPVVYDEAEKDRTGSTTDNRIQLVLSLARSASSASGSSVVKGSQSGSSVAHQVYSMFCMSSISSGVRQEQDKTRVSLLQLHGTSSIGESVRQAHWASYRDRLYQVERSMGQRLIGRTLGWLRDGRLAETVRTFRDAAAMVLGDSRSGDQYGTLYAGAWTLASDDVPTMIDAKELVGSSEVHTFMAEQMPEGHKVLEALLQAPARLEFERSGTQTLAVGELVDAVRPGCITNTDLAEYATKWLNRNGMRVDVIGGVPVLMMANRSKWVASVLRETPYADNWRDALRSVEGVDISGPTVSFHAGLVSRVVLIPLTLLETNDE